MAKNAASKKNAARKASKPAQKSRRAAKAKAAAKPVRKPAPAKGKPARKPAPVKSKVADDAIDHRGHGVLHGDRDQCAGLLGDLGTVQCLVGSTPNAAFGTSPQSPQPMGTTVDFTDGSSVQGGSITTWSWDFDDQGNGSTAQCLRGPLRTRASIT